MNASDCDRLMSARPAGRYRPPRTRRSALRRDALLARLHAAMGLGVTVVHAPAGYGKTSLLADFVADVDYTARWLTLDSGSAIPEVFAGQLAAALLGEANAVPPSSVGRSGDLQAYLGALVADAGDSDEPILLVIDNVHELADPEALDLLGWLTESLPEGFEVILSGRAIPELVSFDASLVTGDVALIDAGDLAFTPEEVVALCEAHGGEFDAQAIVAATHGWPIAVMASLSGALSGCGPRSPIQSAAWERFLTAQVWGSVPETLQPALLAASVAPTLDTNAAPRRNNSAFQAIVEWLNQHDFLCEPLGDSQLRLNPIFRAFLIDQFARTNPTAFSCAVHDTVATFERDARIADALEFARNTGQFEELSRLVETHGPELLQRGSFALLWHAIKSIPADIIECHDLLAALRARVQAHIASSAEALESADVLLADPGVRGAARLHALLARVRALRLSGDRDEMREAFDSVRAVDCENSLLLSELNYHEAEISLSVDNDLARAEQLLRATTRQAHLSGARVLELLATSTLGQLYTMQGDGPAAVSTLARAVEGWRSLGHSSNIGWTLNNLGMAYLQVGDFESAATVLDEARTEGIQCENRRNEAYATASLGDAELALGHWDAARERYEQAIALCAEYTPDQTLASLSIAGLSAALVGVGDLQQADFFARRALL
ncbi:MAG TPA: tetratricopeptide repeat protein, partial [Tepidiformaceae bacterium]|nr:tetratricopeptide repeat protein [Tepidiformaceae bacterium]